jgi:hypothetical protein
MSTATTTNEALPERLATAGELSTRFHTSREFWRRQAALGRVRAFRLSPKKVLYDLAGAEELVRSGGMPTA